MKTQSFPPAIYQLLSILHRSGAMDYKTAAKLTGEMSDREAALVLMGMESTGLVNEKFPGDFALYEISDEGIRELTGRPAPSRAGYKVPKPPLFK